MKFRRKSNRRNRLLSILIITGTMVVSIIIITTLTTGIITCDRIPGRSQSLNRVRMYVRTLRSSTITTHRVSTSGLTGNLAISGMGNKAN
jgi:hypothetical protein